MVITLIYVQGGFENSWRKNLYSRKDVTHFLAYKVSQQVLIYRLDLDSHVY